MGYPNWITTAGSLGKVTAQNYFNLVLEAQDPDEVGEIQYSLVAGLLPKGLRIRPNGQLAGNPERIYTLEGVPFNVNQDLYHEFTVRATNTHDGSITDRTFNITITGNFDPEIITLSEPLGVFLDGTEVNLQLDAIDLNNDPLIWSVISGSLPPGTELSKEGLITGVIKPYIYAYSTSEKGWDKSRWETNEWEFTTRSNSKIYSFTAAVTDGKVTKTREYKMVVYAYDSMKADTNAISADSARITSDLTNDRPPILLTLSLGNNSQVNSGGYFAFKFDAVDYDANPIVYNIDSNFSTGFDGNANWDINLWDRESFSLPPGLTLDEKTGWLTGYIPTQVESLIEYVFAVYVYSQNNPENISQRRLFKLKVLGNLDLAVDWETPADLGRIDVGKTSTISVRAFAKSERTLSYSLKSGSKLPQGLTLLPDGALSGRVSFQTMNFDKGKTSFDQKLADKFVYDNPTNFDNKFVFTVVAKDYYNQVSGEKQFTIRVNSVVNEPYESLYLKCFPTVENRNIIQQLFSNTDIFDPDDIYRSNDPYYGIQSEIKFLVGYGIKASKINDYITAMQTRHLHKKFYFGEYKLAQGKDTNGKALYDVIYVNLIEDTKSYKTVNSAPQKYSPTASININRTKPKWRNPRASILDKNQLLADNTRASVDQGLTKTNDSWYAFEPLNVISPNDLTLMQKDIQQLITSYLDVLPEWMSSVQEDGKVLGYTSGAIIAYLKPGRGKKALFNLKKIAPHDIKQISFNTDRYILDNVYSKNFNINNGKFLPHQYTSFDQTAGISSNIVPIVSVNFAVDRPFSSINGKSLDYLVSTNGLDGVAYNLEGKHLVFATQQYYVGWGLLENDGWADLDGGEILGYSAKLSVPSIINQQGGVWRINFDANQNAKLTFVKELVPGDYVFVNEGTNYANSYQLYDLNALTYGFTVPKFKQSFSQVLAARTKTTFDQTTTQFINNVDQYTLPLAGGQYVMFPKKEVFTNGI